MEYGWLDENSDLPIETRAEYFANRRKLGLMGLTMFALPLIAVFASMSSHETCLVPIAYGGTFALEYAVAKFPPTGKFIENCFDAYREHERKDFLRRYTVRPTE